MYNGQPYPNDQQFNQMPPKKHNAMKIVLLVIAAILVIGILFALGGHLIHKIVSSLTNQIDVDSDLYPQKNNIAVVQLNGVIDTVDNGGYSHDWMINTVRNLTEDKYNKGICLIVNTPGGSSYAVDELYNEFLKYKETGRPIYVYSLEINASGGIYVSSAADGIYANRNSLVGSIGTIMSTVYDMTGLMEKLGIKATTIYSGANKNMLNSTEEFTDEQKKIMALLPK